MERKCVLCEGQPYYQRRDGRFLCRRCRWLLVERSRVMRQPVRRRWDS